MKRRGISVGIGSLAGILLAACGLSIVADGTEGPHGVDAAGPSSNDGSITIDAAAANTDDASLADGSDGSSIDASCSPDVMTDPVHCGACNHDCLGGTCIGGACQPVAFASGEVGVRGVAVVGTDLLWTRETAGLVRISPLADAGAPTTLISLVAKPTDVAGDGAHIFVTDRTAGTVSRWENTGVNVGVWTVSNLTTPVGIAVDGTTVFWTIQNNDGVEITDYGANAFGVRVTGLNYPSDVALAGGKIYVASGSGILVAPLAGSPVTVVSPTITFKDSGGPDLIHTGLAVADGTVWFTIGEMGFVATVPVTGGTAKVIAQSQGDPQGIAVSSNAIYWANRTEGKIMRLAR